MEKTRFHATLRAALMSLGLGCSTAWAQNALPVFVQGSEVNLRGAPSTSAEAVKKVIIGTECLPLGEAAKQWVRLKCGDVEGFTLKTLVGPDKPDFDALLVQTQSPQTDVKLRLDAAARAATLNPQSDPALELLADLFFEANFKQLAKDTKKGGLHESFVITCNIFNSGRAQRTHKECLASELEKIEYDWHQIRFQNNEFISAMYRENSLFVYSGRITRRLPRGLFNNKDDDFGVVIESRSKSTITDAIKVSLQKAATPPTPPAAQDPSYPKYNEWLMESPGMPALSTSAMQIYRSLPPVWYFMHEELGKKFVDKTCGVVNAVILQLDVHRRASLFFDEADGGYSGTPEGMRVLDVSRNGSAYTLSVQTQQGLNNILLTWPTAEPNVSQWMKERKVEPGPSYYAVARAKNITVRESCNDDN